MPNPRAQDGADRLVQPADLGFVQSVGDRQRMQPRPVQRLIRVDIAQPGNQGLIEQKRLETPPPSSEDARERPNRECVVQRLGPQAGLHPRRVARVNDPPELARVA